MGSPAPEMATSTTEEQRLRSLLLSLQTESAILERIVYKNKNQHRRCPYFQALLKVRRDVRLLQSAALGEILHTLLPIIDGKKPAASAYQAMRLKRKQPSGKHNYQERLLGVARLLSEMAEPILEAAIQISFLLAKSFFTGFSTTILALLARLRVLVQQILLDVVSVFNKVSSLSQKKQSVKLIEEGIEAFREYYPMSGEADRAVTLECLWEEDKFVLIERANNNNVKPSDVDQEALPLEAPIQYETVDLFNEVQSDDGDFSSKKTQNDLTARDLHLIAREPSINSSTAVSETHGIGVKLTTRTEDGEKKLASASEKSASVGSDSRKKRVAFVSVAKPKTSDANTDCSNKKMKSDSLINDATETVSVAKPKTSDANTDWSNKKMKSDSLINDATETDDPFLSLLLGGRENNNSVF